MQMEVKVIRSRRKTLSLEITKEAKILVRAPYQMKEPEIENFIQEKSDWIAEHLEIIQGKLAERAAVPRMSMEEVHKLADEAVRVLPGKAAYYAPIAGVTYGRITIRNQRTRWGSCSGKGNLNFNCLLMLAPEEVQDYVVVHELCHLTHMNHSKEFWNMVGSVMPDYKAHRKWLKEHGSELTLENYLESKGIPIKLS